MRSREKGVRGQGVAVTIHYSLFTIHCLLLTVFFSLSALNSPLFADTSGNLNLNDLISEGLKNNPEMLMIEARAQAAGYRIPQAKSLPDPMFMFGYQNEGFQKFTIGEEPNAQGMFGVSQMFLFPGKRALKGEMATKEAEGITSTYHAARLKVVAKIKELYYDLFLAYKNIDILEERNKLFSRVESAALARYSSGMGSQQEVVMAQTEKYMPLEKEVMLKQKMQALEGMINATVGKEVNAPLGRPVETPHSPPYAYRIEDLLQLVKDNSPEIKSKEKMIQGAETKVKMAHKEYYPDVTIGAGYYPRTQGLMDMWSLTATVNLPIYNKTKQSQAVNEANSSLIEAKRDLRATHFMLSSGIRENYSMVNTSNNLMKLYKDGLIPKTYQDFELSLAGYVNGKTEAITVITRLKTVLDYETLYWGQFVEREKAIARLEAITGGASQGSGVGNQGSGGNIK